MQVLTCLKEESIYAMGFWISEIYHQRKIIRTKVWWISYSNQVPFLWLPDTMQTHGEKTGLTAVMTSSHPLHRAQPHFTANDAGKYQCWGAKNSLFSSVGKTQKHSLMMCKVKFLSDWVIFPWAQEIKENGNRKRGAHSDYITQQEAVNLLTMWGQDTGQENTMQRVIVTSR